MSDTMSLYNKAKELGAKKEADAFMKDLTSRYTEEHPAPDEEIAHGLENIIHKYEFNPKEGNVAAHTTSSANTNSFYHTAAVMGIAASALIAFSTGVYLPPLY